MNKKSTASGVSVMPRKYFKKHKASTKMVAVSLAFLMFFSALSANVASVVKLLDVKAASTDHDESDYYESTLTLYDYHTDDQLKYGINRNDGYALGADNLNSYFNHALLNSGCVDGANVDGGTYVGHNLRYFPLYLGLQYANQSTTNNFLKDNYESKNYSIAVNSQNINGDTIAIQTNKKTSSARW